MSAIRYCAELPGTTVHEERDIARLEIQGLSKRFGPVVANDGLSLKVRPGEIVVLLGENGAGKTTLLHCLAGMLTPDSGEIAVDGRPVRFDGPGDALRAGIGTVYQHFALVPTFTVEEQLRLAGCRPGMTPGPAEIGASATATVGSLPLGVQQRIEIARALVKADRVLLLDEPTSVLAPPEVDSLFGTLRQIRERGTAIVLITHKLREALVIGDRIIVLRAGQVVGERSRIAGSWPGDIESELLTLMFGAESSPLDIVERSWTEHAEGDPLLSVEQLSTGGSAVVTPLRDISFALWPGEIVTVAGIDGNGQRELAETLAGFRVPVTGRIRIEGRHIAGLGPASAREAGVTFLTDDRRGEGSVASRSLAENLALTRLDKPGFVRFGLLRRSTMKRDASRLIERFNVLPSNPSVPLGTLSGGNVQKLMLARAVAGRPRLLICLKPTSGLDARTALAVHGALREFVLEGRSVVFLTNELEEAVQFGDRVGALHGGRLSPLKPRHETSAVELGRFMVGAA